MSKKVVDNNNSSSILSVKNLYVIYNNDKSNDYKVAINNFSYDFKKGLNYCIIGQSGSGKSSLINCFNGLSKPEYGYININGNKLESRCNLTKVIISKFYDKSNNCYYLKVAKDAKYNDVFNALKTILTKEFSLEKVILKKDISKNENYSKEYKYYKLIIDHDLKEIVDSNKSNENSNSCVSNKSIRKKIKNYLEIRKSIGMVYQFPEFQLFKSTILADASFGAINLKIPKEESIERAKQYLRKLEIPETKFDSSPFELSGGQKRRVALAGIFAIDPLIYVFDEPTAGLDPQGEQKMISYMLDLKDNNKTLIIITHSMDQVLSIADEVLVIHDGKLVKSGDPYDVFFDEQILKTTNIIEPFVISTIKQLIKKNKKFNKLLEMKPKNIDDLSKSIIKIVKGNLC